MTIAIVEAGPGSQPGHIDPELTDRSRPDRARDVLQLQSDRIQRPGQKIIVEQTGLDPEDLLHRPAPGPVLHPHQRRGETSAGWPPTPRSPARASPAHSHRQDTPHRRFRRHPAGAETRQLRTSTVTDGPTWSSWRETNKPEIPRSTPGPPSCGWAPSPPRDADREYCLLAWGLLRRCPSLTTTTTGTPTWRSTATSATVNGWHVLASAPGPAHSPRPGVTNAGRSSRARPGCPTPVSADFIGHALRAT